MADGRTAADRLISPALRLNAGAALAFLYLPVVVMAVFSFSSAQFTTTWGGFSTRAYERLFADQAAGRALANSLVIAGATAALAAVLGTLLALGLERRARTRPTAALDVAVVTPVLVPDIVQAIALLSLFVAARIALGRTTVVLAHAAFATSYVALVVRARLAGRSRDLELAAMDLGAAPLEAFRRVTLPIAWPGIVSGALLAFTLSLDEFVITFFTSGPGGATLPVHVWSLVRRRGLAPEVNALSALLVAASIGLVALSVLVQRRRKA